MEGRHFVLLGAVAVAYLVLRALWRWRRLEKLKRKYGNVDIAINILRGRIWEGMTEEQLLNSWGHPEDRDETVYKTKTVETLKYGREGSNRFKSRVKVENGVVVGWQQR